jgi:uncharacterized membrane protein
MLAKFIQLPWLLDVIFVLIGVALWLSGALTLRDDRHPARGWTGAYWFALGALFMFGSVFPYWFSGALVVALVAIDGFGKVRAAPPEKIETTDVGKKVFIPVLAIPCVTFLAAFGFKALGADAGRGAVIGFGASGLFATAAAIRVGRASFLETAHAGRRLTEEIGALHILPQLLASLGVLFTLSGVGTLVSDYLGKIVPGGSPFFAGAMYLAAMTLLTMLLGNSFASFSVIMTGVGVPLVIAPFGLDPAFVAILGLTAGSCGTLSTPMAANFNLLPAALYEMTDPYGVVRFQWRFAAALWLAHLAVWAAWLRWFA